MKTVTLQELEIAYLLNDDDLRVGHVERIEDGRHALVLAKIVADDHETSMSRCCYLVAIGAKRSGAFLGLRVRICIELGLRRLGFFKPNREELSKMRVHLLFQRNTPCD